jgi:hypothetical protein
MINSLKLVEYYTSQRIPMLFVDPLDFDINVFVEHFQQKGTEVIVMAWDAEKESVIDFDFRVTDIGEFLVSKNKPVAVIFMGLHAYGPEMQQAVLDVHFNSEHMVFGHICDHENLVGLCQEFIDTFTVID